MSVKEKVSVSAGSRYALCFDEDITVEILDCTCNLDFAAVAFAESGPDDDELIRASWGAVVQVEIGCHANFIWEV